MIGGSGACASEPPSYPGAPLVLGCAARACRPPRRIPYRARRFVLADLRGGSGTRGAAPCLQTSAADPVPGAPLVLTELRGESCTGGAASCLRTSAADPVPGAPLCACGPPRRIPYRARRFVLADRRGGSYIVLPGFLIGRYVHFPGQVIGTHLPVPSHA